jgi:DNA-binding MarR family transcriptional regulator
MKEIPMNELGRLLEAIDRFRDVHKEMGCQTVALFLQVALHPGITIGDLIPNSRLVQSSVSRNLTSLREIGSVRGAKFGLLHVEENPDNRREKIVWLTPKGDRLGRTLKRIIRGESQEDPKIADPESPETATEEEPEDGDTWID